MKRLVCRLIGCTSPFASRWEWPHAICARLNCWAFMDRGHGR